MGDEEDGGAREHPTMGFPSEDENTIMEQAQQRTPFNNRTGTGTRDPFSLPLDPILEDHEEEEERGERSKRTNTNGTGVNKIQILEDRALGIFDQLDRLGVQLQPQSEDASLMVMYAALMRVVYANSQKEYRPFLIEWSDGIKEDFIKCESDASNYGKMITTPGVQGYWEEVEQMIRDGRMTRHELGEIFARLTSISIHNKDESIPWKAQTTCINFLEMILGKLFNIGKDQISNGAVTDLSALAYMNAIESLSTIEFTELIEEYRTTKMILENDRQTALALQAEEEKARKKAQGRQPSMSLSDEDYSTPSRGLHRSVGRGARNNGEFSPTGIRENRIRGE